MTKQLILTGDNNIPAMPMSEQPAGAAGAAGAAGTAGTAGAMISSRTRKEP